MTNLTDLAIAVTDDWQRAARDAADWSALEARATLQFFSEPFADEAAAAAALAPFTVIVPMRERLAFRRSLLTRLPRLRMLALTGYGTSHVDMSCCAERGIVCCGSGSYSPAAPAELTLGLMLAALRQIAAGDAAMRQGGFQSGILPGQVLEGQTLGVIGFGRIGARVAAYALAFGMRVIAWSPNLSASQARQGGATAVSKAELLRQSDIVSLHMVLSERSRGTLGAADLALMKPGALLVNTSRGPLIDETALIDALRAGRIRAALDVYDQEPLPSGHALRSAPNTVLTPHLGFTTERTFAAFYRESVQNILAYLDGHPIRILSA
jgi:phosphoglycerate dehydrogenase-like enzyme